MTDYGRQPPLPLSPSSFHAYGDESNYEEVVTYGLLTIDRGSVEGIEDSLAVLKRRYGIPENARFHSREVFNGSARRKTPWAPLGAAAVFQFAREMATMVRSFHPILSLGAVSKVEYPSVFPGVGRRRTPTTTKHLAALAFAAAAMLPGMKIGSNFLTVWVDPDTTIVDWGGARTQSDRMYQWRDPKTGRQLAIHPCRDERPTLLEVADLFAYSSAHALSGEPCRNAGQYQLLYRVFDPWEPGIVQGPPENHYPDGPRVSSLTARHRRLASISIS